MDEFKRRFAAAKKHRKAVLEANAREVYMFCYNGREHEWDGLGTYASVEPEDIFSDEAATLAEEFTGELFSTMTPENAPWVSYEAGGSVDEGDVEATKQELEEYEDILTRSVRSSNYYSEGPTAFQDAVVGTIAMWVEKPTLTSPIVHEAIPAPELFLRLGGGGIDDRFRQRRYAYTDLQALFPDVKTWPEKIKIKMKSKGTVDVVWGFWKTYADASNPIWVQQIRVGGEGIGLDKDIGDMGAVPIVVGRFNPLPGRAYGWGPGQRMLPTMRTLDEMVKLQMEGLERVVDPAYMYSHDGMLDLSDGIEPGMGYPSMPGTSESFKEIGVGGNIEATFLSEERLQHTLAKGFYREDDQKGKTPPSAAQYIGQEQKQLRRVARPAAKLWNEFGVGVLKRHEWLERQPGGALEDVDFALIENGTVVARPISPLERAQAREDVLVAQSLMGMAQEALGPDQAGLLIDGPTTMGNIKGKLKDELVTFRTEGQIAEIMEAMQPQQPQGAPDGQAPVA